MLCISGCSSGSHNQDAQNEQPAVTGAAGNAITQVSTIDALLAGVYQGHMSLEELQAYGNFGIGTFEGLDGEMILLEGIFYQVKADGKVYQPGKETRTPFACVIHFSEDYSLTISSIQDMGSLEALIDSLVPHQNRFVAYSLHGTFSHMRTRSVPAQTKPYPPLAEVTQFQPVFDLNDITGTIIGFRSPAFVKGVNVPGHHMHFLADDHTGGGHILAFSLLSGQLEMDTSHSWLNLYLPSDSEAFHQADLSTDRTKELHYVEKEQD